MNSFVFPNLKKTFIIKLKTNIRLLDLIKDIADKGHTFIGHSVRGIQYEIQVGHIKGNKLTDKTSESYYCI